MKRTRFVAVMILWSAVTAATSAAAAEPLAIGGKLPPAAAKVKMKSANDGKLIALGDIAGPKGTLVVFTCNHCPFARAWEQRIVGLGNEYAKKGIGAVLINSNDPAVSSEDDFAGMQAHVKSAAMAVPYVMDETSAVALAFGASVTPEAFLFDKAGTLAYHGAIDDNRKEPDKVQKRFLKDALDAVVAGKKPSAPKTKGLGCGIKFRKPA